MTHEEVVTKITSDVHSPLEWSRYNETWIRDNTNCYSHAIGTLGLPLKCYRIGVISETKPITEKFKTESEVVQLLFKDLDVLGLTYDSINDDIVDDKLLPNQYIIKMYIRFYANGQIADYHFMRYEDNQWTEMWNHSFPSPVDSNYYENRWDWKKVLTLKITR